MTVNVHEAKTHLSRLLRKVQEGEEIVIARDGRPVAKLVPIAPKAEPRGPGSAQGRLKIHKNFDAPLADWDRLAR